MLVCFSSGQHILDGVVVANEVVDIVKKRKLYALLFKVDFEKVYSSVS